MSLPKERALGRGVSTLAALVFIAILGGVALGIESTNFSASSQSQIAATAAPPVPTPRPTTPTAGPDAAKIEALCKQMIAEAKANNGKSKEHVQKIANKDVTIEADMCVGAIGTGDQAKCVGAAAIVTINKDGTGTIKSNADASVAKGTCKTQFCDATTKKCTDAKNATAGTSLHQLASDPNLVSQMTPDQIRSLASLTPLPNQQDILRGAFDTVAKNGDTTLSDIAKERSDLQAQIDQYTRDCDKGENPNACAMATTLNDRDRQLAAQQAALRQQMDALAAAQAQLTPTGKNGNESQAPCPAGQSGNPCTTTPPTPPCSGSNCNAGPGSTPSNNNTFGNSNPLASLLSGLARGLGSPSAPQAPQAQPAQQCSADPNAYAQQQQQYQQAQQQYNYQLQQYNYQQQLNQYNSSYYGYGSSAPLAPSPAAPSPCTPSTGQQCTAQPQRPDPASCTAGTWQPTYSGVCITNWQCSTGAGKPQAQLSCQPQVADVGMSLAVSFSCSSGTATGSGFDTAGQQSGSATTVVQNPPAGANTATYTLTCNNNGQTAGAQCSVQISRPSIILVANPKSVEQGGISLIGWITSGMQSCVISSPDQSDFTARNAANTSVNGTATTSAITAATSFLLHCQTIAGGTKDATTTVAIGNGSAGNTSSITITSDAEGKTINHGDTASVTWDASNQPSGSAIALWLVDLRSYATTALIAGAQALSGTYTWHVPSAGSTCPSDAANICGADLVAGRQYWIEADAYTPHDAYVGDGARPANAQDPHYGDYADTTAFTVGQ